jgi:hypothetical protein
VNPNVDERVPLRVRASGKKCALCMLTVPLQHVQNLTRIHRTVKINTLAQGDACKQRRTSRVFSSQEPLAQKQATEKNRTRKSSY